LCPALPAVSTTSTLTTPNSTGNQEPLHPYKDIIPVWRSLFHIKGRIKPLWKTGGEKPFLCTKKTIPYFCILIQYSSALKISYLKGCSERQRMH
jgi:hypothetical protein